MSTRARILAALAAGAIFGIGLGIAGMTRPSKILAFLDVTGGWDPSLAFVMMGAIGVHFGAVRIARGKARPVASNTFHFPADKGIDAPLLIGATVFGVGWGLGGFCPGPALVSAASGSALAVVFVVSMVAGMYARRTTARG